ncbi:MAG: ribosome biogenesis GTPase Der [Dehalococcoidia bacterium]|nr:ribosome biogenesis GTPase Der [Dehalococcoidia bacterium]
MEHPLPVVAVVGRPNVGKSSLFNRLMGQRLAIVSDIPGTTRDRLIGRAVWDEHALLLMDTGGLVLQDEEVMTAKVRQQVNTALAEADLVLFIVDAAAGLHPGDQEVAKLLHRRGKPVLLVANKTENRTQEHALSAEFARLGFGEPMAVTAMHNLGIMDLQEKVLSMLPTILVDASQQDKTPQLAIVGRPNAGKSSLLNAIAGEERVIVDDTPGTTRDTIDTTIHYKDHELILIDTAGVRRRGKIEPGIEHYSVLRVLQAIERCNVAILVLDATELVTAQDEHIAGFAAEAYKGIVVVVNKWDLAPKLNLTEEIAGAEVKKRFTWASYAPICFTSALKKQGLETLMNTVLRVFTERNKRVEQKDLDEVLKEAIERRPTSSHPAHPLRIFRMLQVDVNPPTFVAFVNNPSRVHFSYRRYLENQLRSRFGFEGNHLRLVFKGGEESRTNRRSG